MANNYIRRQFSDTVSYTDQLSGSLTNSATTFSLKDGTTFPTGSVGPFVVTIDPNLSSEEKVLCSSRTGSSFAVASSGRGFGGTTAVAHNANASVIHTICGQDLDEANQAVVQTVGKITSAGDLLYGSGANANSRLGIGTANQVLSSSGTAPQWSTLLGLIEDQFTASGQIVQGTGSGSGQLIQLLAAIEAVFTSNKQILMGTGSGTGELIDLLAALELEFASAGQLIVGTGSGTGELLAKGSAGSVLTVGGADASGLEWVGPVTSNNLAGHLASNYNLTVSMATFLTTGSLGVGTWLVQMDGAVTVDGPTIEITTAPGTATATLEGKYSTEIFDPSGAIVDMALTFIATVTVAGTLVFQGKASTTSSSPAILATTSASSLTNATGYTAVRIA